MPSGGSLDKLREHIGAAARADRAAALDAWLREIFPSHLPGRQPARGRRPGPARLRPATATSTWCCCTTAWPGSTGSPPRCGTRSGTPGSASTTRCAPCPRRCRSRTTTSRSRSACSTPGTWPATQALSAELIAAAGDQWRRTAVRLMPAAQGDHHQPLGDPRRAGLPARGRPQGGGRRPARRDHPARHRPGRGRRHHAPRGPRRQPAPARHPRRPAPRGRPPGGPARRPGARRGRRAARPRRRRRPAAPGRRRRPDRRARPRRRLAGRRPAARRPPPRRARPASPIRRPVARDVVEQDGELVLARTAIGPVPDPSLSLRVAAAAATVQLPIARATSEWLASFCPPLPTPWPPAARAALVSLLGSGPGLLPTWETCDRYGLIDAWLPEWARMRSLPQHHPVHRFTLDRHLVQAAYEATAYAREVDRPDLLLIGAFLHDVGKGLPGDHSIVGAPIAADIATRIGLPPADVATIEQAGPAAPAAAGRGHPPRPERPGDHLHGGRAGRRHRHPRPAARAGPGRLARHRPGRLVGLEGPADGRAGPPGAHRAGHRRAARAAGPRPGAARGRRCPPCTWTATGSRWPRPTAAGLLAAVAACLAMHRLDVVGANASTVDGRAIVEFFTQPRYGSPYDPVALAADLRRVAAGDVSVTQRVRARAMSARGGTASPRVVWQRDVATDAAVLELRAADSPGLLYRVAHRARRGRRRGARGPHLHPRRRRGGRVLPGRRVGRRGRAGPGGDGRARPPSEDGPPGLGRPRRCLGVGRRAMTGRPSLLDDHIRAIGPGLRLALTATASRNRSLGARQLLARAALGDAGTLDELLAAARAGDRRWLRRIRRRVQPSLLAAVAQTIALQDQLPTDTGPTRWPLYELIRRALGRARLTAGQPGAARPARVRPTRGRSGPGGCSVTTARMPEPARGCAADRPAQPVRGGPAGGAVAGARSRRCCPAPVRRGPGRGACRSTGWPRPPADRVEAPHRVSVVVTAYRPDRGLLTAVRSILAQTWANVEIIIVDDASPPEFDEVLRAAAALGERIRLVRLPVNAGTYAARNAGLDAAGGEFVAFQDSDDWSHPRRLELQVAPLLAGPAAGRHHLGRPGRHRPAAADPAGRAQRPVQPVVAAVPARRGAAAGRLLRPGAQGRRLGVHRTDPGGVRARRVRHLDAAAAGPDPALGRTRCPAPRSEPHWMHPARTAYSSAYLRQHQLIAAGAASAYRPAGRRGPAVRGAAAPARRRPGRGAAATTCVLVADWRFLESAQRTAVDEIQALAAAGLRVAVLQLESYRAVYLAAAAALRAGPAPGQRGPDRPGRAAATRVEVRAGAGAAGRGAAVRRRGCRAGSGPGGRVVVADRAPVRGDGADRRYVPADLHGGGAPPLRRRTRVGAAGCRGAGRSAYARRRGPPRRAGPAHRRRVAPLGGRSAPATGPARSVVGTDLCDAAAWPPDVADALAGVPPAAPTWTSGCGCPTGPARARRSSCRAPGSATRRPTCGPRPFLHQLDFYLHFPPPEARRVVLPPGAGGRRDGLRGGDAGALRRPSTATRPSTRTGRRSAPLIARYRADPALFAEQSRRARAVVAKAHDPALAGRKDLGAGFP